MSDQYEDQRSTEGQQRVFANKYSRSQGVESYARRRKVGTITRVIVSIALILVVGGAIALLTRQFWYMAAGDASGQKVTNSERISVDHDTIKTVQPASTYILGAGDVIMNNSVLDSGRQEGTDAYNFTHLFGHIKGELEGFDLCLVDQETALAGSSYGYGYSSPLNAPQDLGRAELAAGFNVILRATDHTLDTGHNGIHNELSWWHTENPETPVLGIAEPDPERNPGLPNYVDNVYTFENKGFKVAIINHTWGVDEYNESVVSHLTEKKVESDVEQARELGADVIVACPHWGRENDTELSEEETYYAQLYADLGVDVILGTHPRVLQKVEVLEGEDGHKTVCYYSLGCLVSSLEGDSLLGGIAEFTLSRDGDGNCGVEQATLKPIVTHRASGNDFTVYLLSDYTDELAASSWDNRSPESFKELCSDILGGDFDSDSCELHVDL